MLDEYYDGTPIGEIEEEEDSETRRKLSFVCHPSKKPTSDL